ncbi:MAG: kynureninase [Alphaproteobacteria bacterium]|nr:kynureninase [Alphaproteobacteria bacterium]
MNAEAEATRYRKGLDFARQLDQRDPLARFRDRFHIPKMENGEDEIYLCGNSLGLQPRSAADYVTTELESWQRLGVKGHFEGPFPWLPYHELLARNMAALVGGEATEVVTMNSLTANLHLMMVSFYRPTNDRYKILIEDHAFPSDHYAVESQIKFHCYDPAQAMCLLRPRDGEELIHDEDVRDLIEREGESIALIMLPGVQYYTGQVFDMAEITRLGHEKGCVVGFDLAHAVGNVPLQLHDWGADFAVWCTYKYLNAGPGSVGGCFVHARHDNDAALPRFSGWWGHDKATRFKMGPRFEPIPGAEGWQLSNPPILSLAAIRASLDVFADAGHMAPLREKSLRLTGYLEWLLREELGETVVVITPRDPDRRGCQLSLRLVGESGKDIFGRLEKAGVTGDWREPDVIRVAPVPLYNCFEDCYRFVEILKALLKDRSGSDS